MTDKPRLVESAVECLDSEPDKLNSVVRLDFSVKALARA